MLVVGLIGSGKSPSRYLLLVSIVYVWPPDRTPGPSPQRRGECVPCQLPEWSPRPCPPLVGEGGRRPGEVCCQGRTSPPAPSPAGEGEPEITRQGGRCGRPKGGRLGATLVASLSARSLTIVRL